MCKISKDELKAYEKEKSKAEKYEFSIFDPFNFNTKEELHSNILAWLLDYKASHGLGNAFFKAFLLKTKNIFSQLAPKAALKSVNFDIENAEILREYPIMPYELGNYDKDGARMDIFMVNHKEKFVGFIENKINARETGNQLAKYAKYMSKFKGYKVLPIYLKPSNNLNSWKTCEDKYFIPLNYKVIKDVIETVQNECPSDDLKKFLKNYSCLIDEVCGYDEDASNMAFFKTAEKIKKANANKVDDYIKKYNLTFEDNEYGEKHFIPKELCGTEYKEYKINLYFNKGNGSLGIELESRNHEAVFDIVLKLSEEYGAFSRNKYGYYWVEISDDIGTYENFDEIISKAIKNITKAVPDIPKS